MPSVARATETLNPAFVAAAAKAPPRTAPTWRSSYPGLQRAAFEDVFPSGQLDDMGFEALGLSIDRSLAYLRSRNASRVASVGGVRVRSQDMVAALESLKAKLSGSGSLSVQDVSTLFDVYRTRAPGSAGKATGYFEPVVQARLQRSPEFNWPIYPAPADLKKPDDTRRQIMFQGSLKGRAEPLAYLPTAVDVSVLQIQGSAMLDLGDGTVGRVNYQAANGRPYKAIANALLDVIPLKRMSMEAIKSYLYANPQRWEEVLSYDPSYVFLRPVSAGPIGTIQQVVTAERAIAVDARRVPLGSLCFISIPSLSISRLVLAQDTGGAIKGPGRFDYFRGTGPAAAQRASAMNEAAALYVLLPKVVP